MTFPLLKRVTNRAVDNIKAKVVMILVTKDIFEVTVEKP